MSFGSLDDRPSDPRSPAAAALVVATGALLGAALVVALAASASPGLGLVWALLLLGLGLLVGAFAVPRTPEQRAAGRHTFTGVGVALVVLGAYLAGTTILAMLLEHGTRVQATGFVLLAQGVPLVALAGAALLGRSAAVVGSALVAVPLGLTLLSIAGLGIVPLALVGLACGVAGLVVLLLAPVGGRIAMFAGVFGAVGAAATIPGLGSPVASLQVTAFGRYGGSGLPAKGVIALLVVLGLVASAAILVTALARRQHAAAVVAAITFAVPTVLSVPFLYGPIGVGGPTRTVSLVLPLLLLAALAILVVPGSRRATSAALPPGARARLEAVPPGVWSATAALVVVFLVAQPLRMSTWDHRVLELLAIALLGGALTVGVRMPGTAGAIVCGTVLVVLAIVAPWNTVAHGRRGIIFGDALRDPGIGAAIALVLATAAVAATLSRHRHPGVLAAATYLVLAVLATVLRALVGDARGGPGPIDLGAEAPGVVVAFLPVGLVVIGAAAVSAFGSRRLVPGAQAVGAVAAAAGAFAASAASIGSGRGLGQVVSPTGFSPFAPTVLGSPGAPGDPGSTTTVLLIPVAVAGVLFAVAAARRVSSSAGAAAALLIAMTTIAACSAGDPNALAAVIVGVVGLVLGGLALYAMVVGGAAERSVSGAAPPAPGSRLG
ncbi:hypothetical protein [Patulibacter minatonensis]|uniref:hypothetical protein n=1 Tax=Patulibacter minatonensis TaxID=298163 RepID=UPI0004ACE8A8|nr:hypothetical protein [Patulibacter minatonensis]